MPLLTAPSLFLSLFTSGRPDVVESVPDDPTYNVSSELTLKVSRNDNNALITCAVDHPSLISGEKRSEQALRVLCESTGKWCGVAWGPEGAGGREGEEKRVMEGKRKEKPQTAFFFSS